MEDIRVIPRLFRISPRAFRICIGMVALVIFVSPFFVLAPSALAQDDFGLKKAAESAKLPGSETPLTAEGAAQAKVQSTIGALIGAALTFVGVIFLILVIYGGIIWMIGGREGKEGEVNKAKKIIIAAVIGMVIVFSAYVITNFVLSTLKQAV